MLTALMQGLALVSCEDVLGPKGAWSTRGQYSCVTNNVIYGLTCTVCGMVYIGETKRRLADRVTEHLRSIRLNTPGLPVARHFNLANHSSKDVKVSVLRTCANERQRKTMEERIIFKLGTFQPLGMNATFRSFKISQ